MRVLTCTSSAFSSGTTTRCPASLSRLKRGPASNTSACEAVRTKTALPCPISAAKISNCPIEGRGACHSSTGNIRGTPKNRTDQGSLHIRIKAPNRPIVPAQNGDLAIDTVANGSCTKSCRYQASTCTAQAAISQSGAMRAPLMASGVTTSVTQGIASALAAKPTTDT